MGSIIKICSKIKLVLTGMAIVLFVGALAQVADAPQLEAVNPDKIQFYHIDESGQITDSDGRLRGWIKGNEVYSPALQIKYRLSGRNLEDVP